MIFGPRLVSRVGGLFVLWAVFAAGARAEAIDAANILEATVPVTQPAVPTAAGGARQTLTLTAVGIENFPEYTQLMTYLSRVAGVRAALPQLISGNAVSVQLRFDGAVEQLTRQLALDHRLLPEAVPVDLNAAGNTTNLRYRWQGS